MDLTQLIQNLGFPIAVSVAAFWYIYKNNTAQREDSAKREDRMFTQLDKFGNSLNSFNDTLRSIDNRLEAVEDKLKD